MGNIGLYKNHYELIFQSYTPILNSDKEVVAVIATKLPIININFFNLFFPKLNSAKLSNHLITEQLTQREFEILYLLSNGLSQYEIANVLGVSRGTILKTIMDRILVKIDINENKSEKIIQKAMQLGIHGKIPRNLVEEQIIILED
ncbi:MAG: response regulator transcription factor [Neisseriaceae bacterium]